MIDPGHPKRVGISGDVYYQRSPCEKKANTVGWIAGDAMLNTAFSTPNKEPALKRTLLNQFQFLELRQFSAESQNSWPYLLPSREYHH